MDILNHFRLVLFLLVVILQSYQFFFCLENDKWDGSKTHIKVLENCRNVLENPWKTP